MKNRKTMYLISDFRYLKNNVKNGSKKKKGLASLKKELIKNTRNINKKILYVYKVLNEDYS